MNDIDHLSESGSSTCLPTSLHENRQAYMQAQETNRTKPHTFISVYKFMHCKGTVYKHVHI